MGATVKTDWEVGHPITFSGKWKDKSFEDKGEILSFRPEKEMSYSHWSPLSGADDVPENYHVVHIALDDAGGGTKVTLEQSNLKGGVTDEDKASRADYEKNWTVHLARSEEGRRTTADRVRRTNKVGTWRCAPTG